MSKWEYIVGNASGRRKFRNTVFRLHTWLGLHLCILLAILFASGVLLLFSPELTFVRHQSLWISPPENAKQTVSVGKIYDSAMAERPDGRIDIIASQARPWFGRPVYGGGGGGPYVAHVNPYTGDFVGFFTKGRMTLRDAIRKTHDSLLAPFYTVRVMLNSLAFVLLVIVIAGLITYRRFWKGYFRRPPRNADHRSRNAALHRLVAVWVAPFLLISALSSAVFFLNSVGLKAVPGPAPDIVERAAPLPDGFDGTTLDGLLEQCQNALPGFTELGVNFPKTGAEFVKFRGYDANIGKVFGTATCYADPDAGTAVKVVSAKDGNWMVQIKELAIALHYGSWGGWVSITLWTLFGIASLYLLWTGARVFAARSILQHQPQSGTIANRNTLSLVVEGLGVFKWAYLALFVGMFLMVARALI